jgi:hypothetical protein
MNFRIVGLLFAGLVLGGCDLLQDTSKRPWIGYAFNKDNNRFEFELNDWATNRDCIESLKHLVATRPGLSEPIGCAYRGNSYLRVWMMDFLFGGKEIDCITRRTNPVETEGGTGYNAKLKGYSGRRGDDWYCV